MRRTEIDEITKTVKMLKPLKLLLGIDDDSKDDLLLFLIDSAIELILGYCRREKLAVPLYNTAVEIAADLYRAKGYGREAAPEVLKSLTEGKRSVSYADKISEEDILSNYYRKLKPYINRRGILPSEVNYDD